MSELRPKLCKLAQRIGKDFGAKLDYSPESISEVEKMLGELHQGYLETRDEEGLRGIALEFAAYIVTVIERHFGKIDWQRDHPSMGEDSFPLYWNGATLFPMSWCLKRIIDGPGDDISAKWKVCVLDQVRPPGASGKANH